MVHHIGFLLFPHIADGADNITFKDAVVEGIDGQNIVIGICLINRVAGAAAWSS